MSLSTLQSVRTAWIASDDPAVLERISEQSVHLALWTRPRPKGLDWLDTLDFDEIDDVQETLAASDLGSALPAALEAAGYPAGVRAAVLATEIAALTGRFAHIMQSDSVRLRLEVVETDACRKFHMDNVTARLLMPLTEPGTQWIEADGGPDTPVNHLHAGEVGLFKGRIWAEAPAILHRSPPIAGTGLSRLLLVLDGPLQVPEGEAS
ncbi:DUF1826 domain-containing protein [Novosphingobium sp. BL-8H]|uniref:DUF1826 domain-containing protein n=1 Tax=Novosphingobium sp. BL-8H TaxID=3127640 RepID=UPI0037572A9B